MLLFEIFGCQKKQLEESNFAKIAVSAPDSMYAGQHNTLKLDFEKIKKGDKINLVLQKDLRGHLIDWFFDDEIPTDNIFYINEETLSI